MKKKKIISLILALVMVLGMSQIVSASSGGGDIAVPYYNYMTSCAASIGADGTELTLTGRVNTYDTCVVKIQLDAQKSPTGSEDSWVTFRNFPTVTVSSGTVRTALKTIASVPTGYYYRTAANVSIYVNGVLVESDTVYSGALLVP
ncbi:MAG: hypothetical protein ACI4IT_05340 [Oscillospiraceae bacterium]